MSSYLNYYIEFKKDDKWNLVSILTPKEKLSYDGYKRFLDVNGTEYHLTYENWKQGTVRDIFSTHGWYNAPFTSRGFPNDMSDELKNLLEEEKLREWEEQKKSIDPDFEYDKNFKKVPRTRPISIEEDFMDYKYDKTYATIEEISLFYQKELSKAKNALKKQLEKDSFTKINEKLDYIQECVLTGHVPDKKKSKKKESDDDYDPIPELEENISDIEFIGSWIDGINAIMDFYTDYWYDLNNIRVICYIS